MDVHILKTGQTSCYDNSGNTIDCAGTWQDGELQIGLSVPEPRFQLTENNAVLDAYSGLYWPRDLEDFPFPLSWQEAWEMMAKLNQEEYLGCSDWRLPTRRELYSLINYGEKTPVLPLDHPFENVQQTWYWTSTTSAMYPDCAWYIHLAGGRMFWGRKDQFAMIWPVRGSSQIVSATGQDECFDHKGTLLDSNQDLLYCAQPTGVGWPNPRLMDVRQGILDRLTGLVWHHGTETGTEKTNWQQALSTVANLREQTGIAWHLPSINELESLVDASNHTPALPEEHTFNDVREVYWSSTTSTYEPDWAYGLYMFKGAVGVGKKSQAEFYIWPIVRAKDTAREKL